MKRMDDVLEAATSRFRYDAGLRQEIVRELRAHLEDSIAAARAGGMDEAQAEEAAVRAFGDPEEIGEKLWQANRRRLRRRAMAIAAVGMVLMPAGVLAAGWFIARLLDESTDQLPEIVGVLAVAVILLYQLTRRFLPKTALFGLDYLWWLVVAFGKSVRIAFGNVWIWVPALAAFASDGSIHLFTMWHERALLPLNKAEITSSSLQRIVSFIPARWSEVAPQFPSGIWIWLLLCSVYILLAPWMGAWLQSASGIAPRRARRWHIVFTISALAWILLFSWETLSHWFAWLGRPHSYFVGLLYCASIPFAALISALFLTIVLRRYRGQLLSTGNVLSPAFGIIGPLAWVFLVAVLTQLTFPYLLYVGPAGWLNEIVWRARSIPILAAAFVPVIIVSEQCGVLRACVRFGDFVSHYLWRYVAFILFGAFLIGLPEEAQAAAFGENATGWAAYVSITLAYGAILLALQLALTVMCFEFYLTRAGTVAPAAAEEAAPQLPSKE